MPCSRRGGAQRSQVVHRAELGVHRVVPALGGADRVRRAGVVGAGDQRVVAALAVLAADRVDRRAGRGRRSRASAIAGICASTALRPPHERGNSSYQAEKRARTRSTSTARLVRQARRAMALGAALDGLVEVRAERGLRRCSLRRAPRARARSMARSSASARSAASSSSTTPSESSPPRSVWPAASLRWSSSRQVAERSVQASIVHSQRPGVSTVNSPAQRTPLMWASTGAAAPRATSGRPAPCSARPRAASRGRRGRCRRRRRRCRRRCA